MVIFIILSKTNRKFTSSFASSKGPDFLLETMPPLSQSCHLFSLCFSFFFFLSCPSLDYQARCWSKCQAPDHLLHRPWLFYSILYFFSQPTLPQSLQQSIYGLPLPQLIPCFHYLVCPDGVEKKWEHLKHKWIVEILSYNHINLLLNIKTLKPILHLMHQYMKYQFLNK